MVDRVFEYPKGARFSVLAPIARGTKGDFKRELKRLKREGFVRVMIDDEIYDLSEEITLSAKKKHDIDVYVDRLVNDSGIRNRLADSIELALRLASGVVIISPIEGDDVTLSDRCSCIECGVTIPDLSPTLF